VNGQLAHLGGLQVRFWMTLKGGYGTGRVAFGVENAETWLVAGTQGC
jgi:uncharacterized membrane protein YedE/YeeE